MRGGRLPSRLLTGPDDSDMVVGDGGLSSSPWNVPLLWNTGASLLGWHMHVVVEFETHDRLIVLLSS